MLPVDIRYSKLSNGPFAQSDFLLTLSMFCYRWTFGIANCPFALLLNHCFCSPCLIYGP